MTKSSKEKKIAKKKKNQVHNDHILFFSLPDTEDLIDPSCSQKEKKKTTTLA